MDALLHAGKQRSAVGSIAVVISRQGALLIQPENIPLGLAGAGFRDGPAHIHRAGLAPAGTVVVGIVQHIAVAAEKAVHVGDIGIGEPAGQRLLAVGGNRDLRAENIAFTLGQLGGHTVELHHNIGRGQKLGKIARLIGLYPNHAGAVGIQAVHIAAGLGEHLGCAPDAVLIFGAPQDGVVGRQAAVGAVTIIGGKIQHGDAVFQRQGALGIHQDVFIELQRLGLGGVCHGGAVPIQQLQAVAQKAAALFQITHIRRHPAGQLYGGLHFSAEEIEFRALFVVPGEIAQLETGLKFEEFAGRDGYLEGQGTLEAGHQRACTGIFRDDLPIQCAFGTQIGACVELQFVLLDLLTGLQSDAHIALGAQSAKECSIAQCAFKAAAEGAAQTHFRADKTGHDANLEVPVMLKQGIQRRRACDGARPLDIGGLLGTHIQLNLATHADLGLAVDQAGFGGELGTVFRAKINGEDVVFQFHLAAPFAQDVAEGGTHGDTVEEVQTALALVVAHRSQIGVQGAADIYVVELQTQRCLVGFPFTGAVAGLQKDFVADLEGFAQNQKIFAGGYRDAAAVVLIFQVQAAVFFGKFVPVHLKIQLAGILAFLGYRYGVVGIKQLGGLVVAVIDACGLQIDLAGGLLHQIEIDHAAVGKPGLLFGAPIARLFGRDDQTVVVGKIFAHQRQRTAAIGGTHKNIIQIDLRIAQRLHDGVIFFMPPGADDVGLLVVFPVIGKIAVSDLAAFAYQRMIGMHIRRGFAAVGGAHRAHVVTAGYNIVLFVAVGVHIAGNAAGKNGTAALGTLGDIGMDRDVAVYCAVIDRAAGAAHDTAHRGFVAVYIQANIAIHPAVVKLQILLIACTTAGDAADGGAAVRKAGHALAGTVGDIAAVAGRRGGANTAHTDIPVIVADVHRGLHMAVVDVQDSISNAAGTAGIGVVGGNGQIHRCRHGTIIKGEGIAVAGDAAHQTAGHRSGHRAVPDDGFTIVSGHNTAHQTVGAVDIGIHFAAGHRAVVAVAHDACGIFAGIPDAAREPAVINIGGRRHIIAAHDAADISAVCQIGLHVAVANGAGGTGGDTAQPGGIVGGDAAGKAAVGNVARSELNQTAHPAGILRFDPKRGVRPAADDGIAIGIEDQTGSIGFQAVYGDIHTGIALGGLTAIRQTGDKHLAGIDSVTLIGSNPDGSGSVAFGKGGRIHTPAHTGSIRPCFACCRHVDIHLCAAVDKAGIADPGNHAGGGGTVLMADICLNLCKGVTHGGTSTAAKVSAADAAQIHAIHRLFVCNQLDAASADHQIQVGPAVACQTAHASLKGGSCLVGAVGAPGHIHCTALSRKRGVGTNARQTACRGKFLTGYRTACHMVNRSGKAAVGDVQGAIGQIAHQAAQILSGLQISQYDAVFHLDQRLGGGGFTKQTATGIKSVNGGLHLTVGIAYILALLTAYQTTCNLESVLHMQFGFGIAVFHQNSAS